MLEVRDPADVRSVVGEVPAMTAPDVAAAYSLARKVAVNLPTAGWDVRHPFGGFRESGSPFKERGAPGLRFCTRIKTTAVRYQW